MGFTLTSACAFGVLFFFISSSSFVFQEVYDLSAQGFSAVFAGNAIGLVLVGQVNAMLAVGTARSRSCCSGSAR